MRFVTSARGMLFIELANVEDYWLWHSGMTGNILEVGFDYFGRLGLENAEGMTGNIAGEAEPIA
jgi:hypothetical protein